MKVIGITGSSGSGKTTISEIFNQRKDTKVINADKMARDLTNSETAYFSEIKEAFQNEDIILEDGNLNRPKLANLICKDNSSLEKLNQITFKHLIPKIVCEMENVEENIKIIVIDAPLLFEAGLDKYCDFTIALQAPVDLKIARICKRDNICEKVAKERLEIQKADEFYCKKADYVIYNDENTSEKNLEKQVQEIIKNVEGKDLTKREK